MGVVRVLVVEDGAPRASIDLSRQTSHTAFNHQNPSKAFQQQLDPTTGKLFSAQNGESTRMVAVPGAYPLLDKTQKLVGSIGLSSGIGLEAMDDASCRPVAEAFSRTFSPSSTSSCASTAGKGSGSTVAAAVLGVLFFALVAILVAYYVMKTKAANLRTRQYLDDPLLAE